MIDKSVSENENNLFDTDAAKIKKKKRKALETKLAIIESGIDLFYKNGFSKTKISDITENAKVAHGTFYVYFSSKEDFFMNILMMSRKELSNNAEESIELAKAGQIENAKIKYFIDGFSIMLKKSKLFGILLFEAMSADNRFKEFYKEGRMLFLQRTKRFLELLGIKEEYKAHIILGLSKHLLEMYIFTGEDPTPIWGNALKDLGIL